MTKAKAKPKAKRPQARTRVTPKATRHTGGSYRATVALPYDQIPSVALRRLAERFALGEATYGRGNWIHSLQNRDHARSFTRDVYNHLFEHALRSAAGEERRDDHLGAILWGASVLSYAEALHGCKWSDL